MRLGAPWTGHAWPWAATVEGQFAAICPFVQVQEHTQDRPDLCLLVGGGAGADPLRSRGEDLAGGGRQGGCIERVRRPGGERVKDA